MNVRFFLFNYLKFNREYYLEILEIILIIRFS